MSINPSTADKVGIILKGDPKNTKALLILNEWRYMHNMPMYNFSINLRNLVKRHQIDNFTISQRLKRIPSIINKLAREPKMKLSKMQDIWGFRIILDDVAAVNTVRDLIKTKKHFWWCSEKNYITLPKSSWYRGVHLIFTKKYSKQDVALKIELQIRTKLQHYRATAVETVWVHLSQPLKSSQWDEKRLSYFSLASAVFSLSENSTLPKEYTKVNILDLLRDFHRQTKKLKVVATLKWFALAQEIIKRELKKHKNQKDNELFLITINAKQDQLSINSYSQRDAELANSKYL